MYYILCRYRVFLVILWIYLLPSQLTAEPVFRFGENHPVAMEPDSELIQRFPYIVIGENGVIHIVFVKVGESGKNIFYCRSEDDGDSFSVPFQINSVDNHVAAFGIAGAKIGLRGDQVIIAWSDHRTGYAKIFMSVSEDAGLSWSEDWAIDDDGEVKLYPDMAIDPEGRLFLAYYAYLEGEGFLGIKYMFTTPGSFEFSPSLDPGLTPGEAEPCSCCAPDIETGPDGAVYIAFRNDINDIRDLYIARKPYGSDGFDPAVPLSESGWEIDHCPSSNPSISLGNEYIGAGFMVESGTNTYARIGNPDDLTFGTANIVNEENYMVSAQNYPEVVMDGDFLHIIWIDDFIYSRDIYYGFAKSYEDGIFNVQRINDDPLISDGDHIDARLAMENGMLFCVWSDLRQGIYRVYLSKAVEQQSTPGDVNQDGTIDVLDIVLTLNFILQIVDPDPVQFAAADLNSDGVLNVLDIVLFVNLITG